MAKILFYDLETTGTMYWKNGIHQFSGIVCINGEVKETFNFKMKPNPNAIIDDKALEIAGVTRKDLESYPIGMNQGYKKFTDLVAKYVDKFNKQDKFHLCGFNNRSFDDPFLRALFTQCGDNYFGSWFWSDSLDVMVLASEKFKEERSNMKDFKLSTIAEKLGITVDPSKLHDALYDVELTRESYYRLCQIK
jgi:DNA polymerase III subunit epsilon